MIASTPSKPNVVITTKMNTTILLSISVDYMPVGNYTFNVTWEKLFPCSDIENGYIVNVTSTSTEYVMQMVSGLDEGSSYNITVTVTNIAGHATSDSINATTMETGNFPQICLHCISSVVILLSAPSAPPEGITVSKRMVFSITVEWQAVPCIHRNGNITGYGIIYHMRDNNQKYNVRSSETMLTIPDLQPSTTYVISVAAVNSEGIGIYGTIAASTLSCELYIIMQKCYSHQICFKLHVHVHDSMTVSILCS